MILEAIINLFVGLVKIILGLIKLPPMPEAVTSLVDQFLIIVSRGLSFLYFFVGKDFLLIIVPLAVLVTNAEHVYKLALFVLKKLPFGIN